MALHGAGHRSQRGLRHRQPVQSNAAAEHPRVVLCDGPSLERLGYGQIRQCSECKIKTWRESERMRRQARPLTSFLGIERFPAEAAREICECEFCGETEGKIARGNNIERHRVNQNSTTHQRAVRRASARCLLPVRRWGKVNLLPGLLLGLLGLLCEPRDVLQRL